MMKAEDQINLEVIKIIFNDKDPLFEWAGLTEKYQFELVSSLYEEIDALAIDAGEEIHNMIVWHKSRLTAADALAKMLTSNHVVSILALLTDIAFSCDKINKNEYKEHMETARKLSDALREYREVSGG